MLREIGAIANGGRTRLLTEGITGGAHGGPSGALGSAADAEATTTIHPLEIANNVVSAGALYDAREEEEDVFVDAEESFAAEDEGAVESI